MNGAHRARWVWGAVAGLALVALAYQALARPHTGPAGLDRLGSPEACERYGGLPTGFGSQPTAGMVRVRGGRFAPGHPQGPLGERPAAAQAVVAPFWIDRTEVTNAQFERFTLATGYRTEAERGAAAVVFRAPKEVARGADPSQWWRVEPGAHWRQPEGPGSSVQGRMHHPVVHVTLADAQAYARWLGRELPTEAEWEWAARAAGAPEQLERQPRDAEGRPSANFWQGVFPFMNVQEDGYVDRAPVGCFAANGWGLHDMIGNVWEWTADRHPGPHGVGAARPASAAATHVIKGGSFLCSADYCSNYRSSARHPHEVDLPIAHVGFRTVWRSAQD